MKLMAGEHPHPTHPLRSTEPPHLQLMRMPRPSNATLVRSAPWRRIAAPQGDVAASATSNETLLRETLQSLRNEKVRSPAGSRAVSSRFL